MRGYGLVLLLLVATPQAAEVAPLHPADFAYGMTLQGGGDGALYSLDLPEELYREVTRADLGDLRIFNRQGEVVPHLVQWPPAADEVRARVALPFYPLLADEARTGGETTLRIVPDRQGAVIELHSRGGETSGKVVTHYILDGSALRQPIRRLILQWQAGSETFVAPVSVEASDDLAHWHVLASSSLAELLYDGTRLQRNEIALAAPHRNYLRLSWPPGAKGVVLSGVEAELATALGEPPLQWRTLEGEAVEGTAGRYQFALDGYYPVERVEVVLPQQNTLVKARLLSAREVEATQWRQHYQGVLYTLQQEGQAIASGPLPIACSSDRYWRLDVGQESGGLGGGLPQLKVGWRTQRLLFVARGAGPFTLAFGSASAPPAAADPQLQTVLDALQRDSSHGMKVQEVVAQPKHILGGAARLQAPPPPLPWKKWLLWAVLLFGVAAMLLMARGLHRQMSGGTGG